jgi:hypothetical protein
LRRRRWEWNGGLLNGIGAEIAVGGEEAAVVDFNGRVFFLFWHKLNPS